MARLKDLESPDEVLEAIRGGVLKNEIIKKYRTSEQELARLLLPMYKSGDLTKEEFNDFFKGVPLRPRETPVKPDEEKPPRLETEDDPPSQIFRSLAADQGPEPAEVEAPKPEEPLPDKAADEEIEEELEEEVVVEAAEEAVVEAVEEVVAEEPEEAVTEVAEEAVVEAAEEAVVEAVEEEETEEPELEISEGALEHDLEEALGEELEGDIPPIEEPEPEAAEEIVTSEVSVPTDDHEEVTTPVGMPVDSAGMTAVLEMLFLRLGSLDNRLYNIEKKLGIAED